MVNDRIKNKIKKMKTTLLASVLTLASLGTSAATNTAQQRNDKHTDKIELTANQKNMNDNLNSYFTQDGIKINGQYQKNKGNNQNNNIQAMQSTRAQSR